MKRFVWMALVLTGLGFIEIPFSHVGAQSYPNHPIQLITPGAAGLLSGRLSPFFAVAASDFRSNSRTGAGGADRFD